MSERAAYSRVYWSVMDDPKFDGIREDVRLFGSWTLLLIVADMAHPAPAFLPPTISSGSAKRLSDAGLIDLLDGHRFRIHGLDAERGRRTEAARVGGIASGRSRSGDRLVTERSPHTGTKSNLDETRRDEGRRDETTREVPDGRDDLEAFVLVKRRAPTQGQRDLLDRVVASHDETGPSWAANIILSNPDDPIGAVIEADKAWRSERITAAKVAESKPRPMRKPPGLPKAVQELADHLAMVDRERNGAA